MKTTSSTNMNEKLQKFIQIKVNSAKMDHILVDDRENVKAL